MEEDIFGFKLGDSVMFRKDYRVGIPVRHTITSVQDDGYFLECNNGFNEYDGDLINPNWLMWYSMISFYKRCSVGEYHYAKKFSEQFSAIQTDEMKEMGRALQFSFDDDSNLIVIEYVNSYIFWRFATELAVYLHINNLDIEERNKKTPPISDENYYSASGNIGYEDESDSYNNDDSFYDATDGQLGDDDYSSGQGWTQLGRD